MDNQPSALTYLIIIGVMAAVVYSLTSFILWDGDPSNWTVTYRIIAAVVFVGTVYGTFHDMSKEKK